jgi:hypothetical protein
MHWIFAFGPYIVAGAIVGAGLLWHYDRKQLVAFYDAHTTAQQRATIAQDVAIIRPLAEAAVPYVEQFWGQLPGAQKFTQAVEHVITALGQRGIAPNPHIVRAEVQKAYAQAKVDGTLAASAHKPSSPA